MIFKRHKVLRCPICAGSQSLTQSLAKGVSIDTQWVCAGIGAHLGGAERTQMTFASKKRSPGGTGAARLRPQGFNPKTADTGPHPLEKDVTCLLPTIPSCSGLDIFSHLALFSRA